MLANGLRKALAIGFFTKYQGKWGLIKGREPKDQESQIWFDKQTNAEKVKHKIKIEKPHLSAII